MRYRTTTIGDIASVQTGPFGSQLHNKDYVLFGTPIVTVEHLGQRKMTRQNLPRVSDADRQRLSRYILEYGDLVFSRVGSVDRCSWVSKDEDGWMFSGRCLRVRPNNPDEIYHKFLYYFFSLESTKDFVRNIAVGATMPSINTRLLSEVPITFPGIEEQREIGDTLSSFDDKIEENTKINHHLEQMAQAIFKSWFVDFEPFGGEMPSDWREGTFSEVISATIGGDWGKDSPAGNNTQEIYCIRGADIPDVNAGNKGKIPIRYILPKNYAVKQLKIGDIVVEISGGSPTQSTGRCALITQSLLDRYDRGMVCTNFCRVVKPLAGYSPFVYFYWKYLYFQRVMFSYENSTIGIKNLDISGFLETEPIIIPPVGVIHHFSEAIGALIDMVFVNGLENETLATTRDTLLPRLMSGELSFADLGDAK